MNLQNTLLMPAFGLLMSALAVQTAHTQIATTQAAKSTSIKIYALPFNIIAPGTYVLTSNLTFPPPNNFGPAITISSTIAGPVVLDFKGFTMTTADSDAVAVIIGTSSSTVPNTYPITIRNGTIQNGLFGIVTSGTTFWSNITVTHMVFKNLSSVGGAVAVNLSNAQSSTISNCNFNNCFYGILDQLSRGGNTYSNNTFVNTGFAIAVNAASNTALTLERCQFSLPPSD